MISIHIHIDESLARRARAVKGFLRRPAVLITSVLLLVAIPLSLRAAPVTIPNQFAAGSPASAADVNANFEALATAVNDNDSRLGAVEATNPLPSAGGVMAYVTTLGDAGDVATSFNSAGGDVTVAQSSTGVYTATFTGLTCTDGNGEPTGAATTVPYIGSTQATCRIGAVRQQGNDCEVVASCFDSSGTLRAGEVSIFYFR